MEDLQDIILFRHGETDWNKLGLVQGRSDIPLNNHGKIQASELAKKLKLLKVSYIFSSSQIRAIATSQIIAATIDCEMSIFDDLCEQNFGIAEGKRSKEVRERNKDFFQLIYSLNKPEANYLKLHGAESRFEVYKRVEPIFRTAAHLNPELVGISTHRGVISSFIAVQFNQIVELNNAELVKITYDRNKEDFTHYRIG